MATIDIALGFFLNVSGWINVPRPNLATTQPAFTCSMLKIETLKQVVKYVQS